MTLLPSCEIERSRLSFGDREEDFVTIEEACEILGLQRSQTRALLGEPDRVWESAAGRIQYIFKKEKIYAIKQKRKERQRKREAEHGLRACYFCREKHLKEKLTGGICVECQAKKLVKNFICQGDYRNRFDLSRLQLLTNVIDQIKQENKTEL